MGREPSAQTCRAQNPKWHKVAAGMNHALLEADRDWGGTMCPTNKGQDRARILELDIVQLANTALFHYFQRYQKPFGSTRFDNRRYGTAGHSDD